MHYFIPGCPLTYRVVPRVDISLSNENFICLLCHLFLFYLKELGERKKINQISSKSDHYFLSYRGSKLEFLGISVDDFQAYFWNVSSIINHKFQQWASRIRALKFGMNIAISLLVSTLGAFLYFLVTFSFAQVSSMQKVILLLPVGKYGLPGVNSMYRHLRNKQQINYDRRWKLEAYSSGWFLIELKNVFQEY